MKEKKREGRPLLRPSQQLRPKRARSHHPLDLTCASLAEMNFWQKFADTEISGQFHLKLPKVYVEFLVTRELESVPVRQCAPVRQREIVAQTLLRAARAYKKLLARAVETGRAELPSGGIPNACFRRMVTQAVHDAIQKCETALYRAPLGLDLFTDVIWPEAKKLLAECYEWVIEFETDDERYRRWRKEGDY